MATAEMARPSPGAGAADPAGLLAVDIHQLYYGKFLAVRDVALTVEPNTVTALIGPSGCGKSTVLRCLNRMNDLVPGFRFDGHVYYHGQDLYAPGVDPVAVRRRVGMVFQQPNPFVTSISKNVAFGLRIDNYRGDVRQRVEESLKGAALWDEVKDKLHQGALSLSGGQQQRLCIARAIATRPDVLLMDEPCSALDPIATRRIEELIRELKTQYTIVIVTHNLQQAQRVADKTAFLYVDISQGGRTGYLVEYADTKTLFSDPQHQHTKDYISGRFG